MNINPYAPEKIYCHYETIKKINTWMNGKNALPVPVTVSIDPANVCNMKCQFCNADFVLTNNNKCILPDTYLNKLIVFLSKWRVKGACWGGGGEALVNKHTGKYIEKGKNLGINSGIVTNGILIHKHPQLSLCSWVGISMDAGSESVWMNVHGVNKKGLFNKVIKNISFLVSKHVHTTYKYLVRPDSINDIYNAIKIAYELGCSAFHIRPVAPIWNDKQKFNLFNQDDIKIANEQINKGKSDFKNLQIIEIFSKLGQKQWEIIHPFKKCWAIYMTCVFQANKKIGFCCDNRGNKTTEIGPFDNPEELLKFWGSNEHKKMQNKINIDWCPRCTFTRGNEFLEQAVIDDGFMKDFI